MRFRQKMYKVICCKFITSRLRRIFFVVLFASLFTVILIFFSTDNDIITMLMQPSNLKELMGDRGFALNTPGCQIPDWDPFDPTVRRFFRKIRAPIKCPGKPSFLKLRPNAIINVDYNILFEHYGLQSNNVSCSYRPILRSSGSERPDDKYYFGNYKKLHFGVPLKDEFIVVNCSLKYDQNYTQYIPLVPLKNATESTKSQKSDVSSDENDLNVILVGIDSISKLNFLRHFEKTYEFLTKNLMYFDLKGYTKVGDNTFPNLVPLLTGHFYEYYCNESVSDMFFDDVDFIWKNFSERGYKTLFSEDAPLITTFNYLKKGFLNPPVDYYFRPFALAIESSLNKLDIENNKACLHSTLEMDVLYNYLKDFARTMEDRPFFAFTFLARLTHDFFNAAGYADEPTFNLLNDLHSEGVLNKSLLVLFSDHGIRYGPIRQTYIGKFEERMPFMFLSFPPWFLKKYPEFEKNLKENQNRLTTPFDIHATLVHLLQLNRQPSYELGELLSRITPHGISLMDPVPRNRTCEKASILPHWCTCQTHKPVPVTEPTVINCADALVNTLNNILKPFADKCAVLTLKTIKDARYAKVSDVVSNFMGQKEKILRLGREINAPMDYLVIIEVSPSEGIFEATVRYDDEESTYKVMGDVSRLNIYGNQSICINDARIRKFCYCLT